MRIAVANLKGGTAKSTTAVYLAHALARQGPTLLVDADPQGSALSWSEMAGGDLPFPVVSMPLTTLHRQLPAVAAAYDHVVVDTPPGHPAIVTSALRAVDLVIVPLRPTAIDVSRLQAMLELVEDARVHNDDLEVRVLLTIVRAGTRSQREVREVLLEDQVPLLVTEIPQREAIAMATGGVIVDLGPYQSLVDELFPEVA